MKHYSTDMCTTNGLELKNVTRLTA